MVTQGDRVLDRRRGVRVVGDPAGHRWVAFGESLQHRRRRLVVHRQRCGDELVVVGDESVDQFVAEARTSGQACSVGRVQVLQVRYGWKGYLARTREEVSVAIDHGVSISRGRDHRQAPRTTIGDRTRRNLCPQLA